MGAFDIDELRRQLGMERKAQQPTSQPATQPAQDPEQAKADCIARCLQLVRGFNAEADARGLKRERLTVGDLGVFRADDIPWPTQQEISGRIFKKVVREWGDFHTVVYYQSNRNLPQYNIDVQFSAVIAPDDSCYIGHKRVDADRFAYYLAKICDFDKAKAEALIEAALQGNPCVTYEYPNTL
ncbi:hypothetical protein [Bifidobacterium simiarum]|uniref:Uncharacterized protein n=1 Tax=Bifidobacterium simiarum TaxID=2045441 RepID=A0A2M9HDS7_9BIFI|nr:hypothetical protein [Bifidobacterium simiarum]PJM74961.1 hypothetical protein CSQ87_06925 [Bifidobacterium simiarum]